jgi:hypothetical protein
MNPDPPNPSKRRRLESRTDFHANGKLKLRLFQPDIASKS